MIDYAYLTTLPSLARVRKNARQWDFFCWLLSQADEDGYAEVSVREYAAMNGIARTTIQSWLFSATFRPLLQKWTKKQKKNSPLHPLLKKTTLVEKTLR